MSAVECGPLRLCLERAMAEAKLAAKDLTVLATQNDPYRCDTPAGHRDAAWFAELYERIKADERKYGLEGGIHLRGAHYAVASMETVRKPNGQLYINDDPDWQWLQGFPAKAARWLGYVPFDGIVDNRSEEPEIYRKARSDEEPWYYVGSGIHVEIPSAESLKPYVYLSDFDARQPYHLVLFAEKSSVAKVAKSICREYEMDAFFMTGECSDTRIYQMAEDGAHDGRKMILLTVTDFDPAGQQMSVSLGRKLQAFKDLKFPDLEFELVPVALTAEQVAMYGLPSKPLKASERRADRWRKEYGHEQTEIDALAQLRPDLLREALTNAIRPFYDETLGRRVREARQAWQAAANEILQENIDQALLEDIQNQATEKLEDLEEQIVELNEKLRVTLDPKIKMPDIEVPQPELAHEGHGQPLVSTDWSWVEQTKALIAHKSYGTGS